MPDTPEGLAVDLRTLADKVAALATGGGTPDPEPMPLAKPTGLTVAKQANGTLLLTWDWAPWVASWEVRDEANPAEPVKEVVTEPRSVRSPMKAWSLTRRYAVVAISPTGQRSEPSDAVEVPGSEQPPDGGGEQPPPTGKLPTDVLPVLKTWTVTTTTGKQGSPTNKYPIGDHASIPGVFYVTDDGGVLFRATVDGFTTPNSKRTRVEARQMADDRWTKAAWNGNSPHVLDAELWASTEGLQKRKRVSTLQIHDGGDDVLQVVADAELGLAVLSDDGDTMNVLDPDYRDKQRFTCRIETGNGKVWITYNGGQPNAKLVTLDKTGTGWYFKAGAYNQASMSEHDEPPTAFGEVCIYKLVASGNPLG